MKEMVTIKKDTKLYPVTAKNSSVNGEAGTRYDWELFDWKGKDIYRDVCWHQGCNHHHDDKAPLPWVDGDANIYSEYLHVPYNWQAARQIFRIYPHFHVGQKRWGKIVTRVKATKASPSDSKWRWEVELTSPNPKDEQNGQG